MNEPVDLQATLVLVRQAQAGDQEALNRIFARYYSRLRGYVRARLGAGLRSELDSVDVMQETFLRALEAFDRFEVRDEAAMMHWLSRIAENQIRGAHRHMHAEKRDRRRQQQLKVVRDSISDGSLCLEPAAEITLPPDFVERAESRERLQAAIDSLDEDHREVLLARLHLGATWDRVAELVGKGSESAARQLFSRAMVELSRRMGEGGAEEA